jgi:glycosyltransferase involved in cell wall biosynthesis
MVKLSVILPCFNGAATLAQQLEALSIQEWSESWELLVVNNGSTDDSMAIVESYRDRLPPCRIIEAYHPPAPRLGVSNSYNLGIEAAQGEAVVFCEADDEVAPGWLAAMGNALAEHDMVAGRLEYHKLNPAWLVAAREHHQQEDGLVPSAYPPYLPYSSGCNLGMRRSLYFKVGKLDLTVPCCYDTDYCWKAQLAGFKLHFVADAVVHYRLRHTLKGLYRQGRSWGTDTPLLLVRYGLTLENFVIAKRLLGLIPFSLTGLKLSLMSLFNIRRGRGGFAWWVWWLGYRVGDIQGLSKVLPAPASAMPSSLSLQLKSPDKS